MYVQSYTASSRDALENTPPSALEISLSRGFCTPQPLGNVLGLGVQPHLTQSVYIHPVKLTRSDMICPRQFLYTETLSHVYTMHNMHQMLLTRSALQQKIEALQISICVKLIVFVWDETWRLRRGAKFADIAPAQQLAKSRQLISNIQTFLNKN